MRRRTQGVALIYVIVLMSLLSVYLMELMSNTRIMLRQTRRAEGVAINRNLQASAQAWARVHRGMLSSEEVVLDANDLSRREASIKLITQENAILAETACTVATQSYKQTRKIRFLP